MIPNLSHLSSEEADAHIRALGEAHQNREEHKRLQHEAEVAAAHARIASHNLDALLRDADIEAIALTVDPNPEIVIYETPIVQHVEEPEHPEHDLDAIAATLDPSPDVMEQITETETDTFVVDHEAQPESTKASTPARPEGLPPELAPGCFGSSLSYEHLSKECSPCPFAAQCAPRAAESWANLRKVHGLDGAKASPNVPGWHVEACRRAGDLVARDRARNTCNQKARRSRLEPTTPKPAKPAPLEPIEPATKEELKRRRATLRAWLDIDGPSQRKLRARFAEILKCWTIFRHMRLSLGRDPTPLEFGRRLVEKLPGVVFKNEASAGQARIKLLRRLEQAGGPWGPVT